MTTKTTLLLPLFLLVLTSVQTVVPMQPITPALTQEFEILPPSGLDEEEKTKQLNLLKAIFAKDLSQVQDLITAGANPNGRIKAGERRLNDDVDHEELGFGDHEDDPLFRHFFIPGQPINPLDTAVFMRDLKIIKLLIKSGARPDSNPHNLFENLTITKKSKGFRSFNIDYREKNAVAIARLLFEHGARSPNVGLVHLCSAKPYPDLMKLFIEKGADVSQADRYLLLHNLMHNIRDIFALTSKHVEIMKMLTKNNDLNIPGVDDFFVRGSTIPYALSTRTLFENKTIDDINNVVDWLRKQGFDLDAVNKNGANLVHALMHNREITELMQKSLDAKLGIIRDERTGLQRSERRPMIADHFRRRALALKDLNIHLINLLDKRGVLVDGATTENKTPLVLAAEQGNTGSVHMLLGSSLLPAESNSQATSDHHDIAPPPLKKRRLANDNN